MARTLRVAGVLLAVAVSAAPAQQTDTTAPTPKSSSSLITEEDIDKVRGTVANALDVVRLLRPGWLRQRSPGGPRNPEMRVYLNDHEMGGLTFLQSLPANHIYTLQFLSVAEVGARYGPTNSPGIVVTLRH